LLHSPLGSASAGNVTHRPRLLQVPPLHVLPVGHWALVVHGTPATLHAWHVPVHAALQHTPSTHSWLAQSLLVAHFVPLPSEPVHTFVPMPEQL
jgi:hypothetical protein